MRFYPDAQSKTGEVAIDRNLVARTIYGKQGFRSIFEEIRSFFSSDKKNISYRIQFPDDIRFVL